MAISREEAAAELRKRHRATWEHIQPELAEFDDQKPEYAADWLLIMIVLESDPKI